MNEMLTELCGQLRNWFEQERYIGDFRIKNGTLEFTKPMDLLNGQYVRIVGSRLNDGVYLYNDGIDGLTDESFHGALWSMAVPTEVLTLADDIATWIEQYGTAVSSPFSSESLSATSYSYTKKDGSVSGSGSEVTWQSTFASRLNRWRKI